MGLAAEHISLLSLEISMLETCTFRLRIILMDDD